LPGTHASLENIPGKIAVLRTPPTKNIIERV